MNAQVIIEQIDPVSVGSTLQTYLENAPVIEMPEFNYKWIEEKEKKTDVPNIKPPRFGYAYETEINNSNDGKWAQEGNVSIWTLTIESKGALSINLIFDEFFLSEGSEFNIYNDTKTIRFGPVSPKHNKPSRKLATDIIKGSSVTLVLTEPSAFKNIKSIISVRYVVHGFATSCSFGDAILNCHINASCSQANNLADEKYAVARILVNNGQSCCSGSLINNTCNDLTPYFLTAFHCIDFDEDRILDQNEEDDIETWAFSYKYISPNCTPSSEPSSWVTYSGADFRASNNETDFLLVEMEDLPSSSTGLTYTGWSRYDNFQFQNEGTTGLHHPGGDVMKFSSDNSEPVENENSVQFCGIYNCFYMQVGTLWEVEFDNGAIEWGSSGSPLFDPNNRIIGQLVGGDVQCPPEPAFYGRISESWARSQNNDEQLAHWLDPNDTGAMTTNTIKIPYITGPSLVCTSNSTFTLYNRPSGTTVNWTRSSNLRYVSGQGADNYTVKAYWYSAGWGGVQATITSTCGETNISRGAWVGNPVSDDLDIVNTYNYPDNTLCEGDQNQLIGNYTYESGSSQPVISDYDWDYSGWSHFEVGTTDNISYVTVPYSFSYKDIMLRAANQCGESEWKTERFYPNQNCGYFFSFSPNPTDDYVEISIDKSKLAENEIDYYEVRIYNSLKIAVFETGKTKVPVLRINTKQFQNGVYFISFIAGEKTDVKQLVVSH